jgi:malate dehydrogenase (oxaloacetate-decarboxylating)(NADP+)
MRAGVKKENIYMFDSKDCITKDRKNLNKYKEQFAQEKGFVSLEEGFKNADVFIGLSVGGVVDKKMVASMAPNPIIFAMANPDPEIMYDEAIDVRDDLIMATGRSDFPNQVNNVLGFEEMKMAATKALAELARQKVPEIVLKAYGGEEFSFGKEYIIPKPFDPRVLWFVAPAVAKAAIETGVARITDINWDTYREQLKERLGYSKEVIRVMINKAQENPVRVVYPEGEEEKIIRAAHVVYNDNIAYPILLGNKKIIKSGIERLGYSQDEFEIIDPVRSEKSGEYAKEFFNKRQRKGGALVEASRLMKKLNYFGSMMVEVGDAEALISGLTTSYPNTIRPALQCIGVKEEIKVVSGLYIIVAKQDVYFFADTTVNVNPTTEQLVDITLSAADTVKGFNIEPRIAMLSFSNFGSSPHPHSNKVRDAVKLVKSIRP